MSPEPKTLGKVDDLPGCARPGLKYLFAVTEGVIQKQIKLLGSGTPSQAPDLRDLLRKQGVDKPEDRSEMIDKYGEHEEKVSKVKTDFQKDDKGIVVQTAGIGTEVTGAYNDVETAVDDLNEIIAAAHAAVHTWKDEKTGVWYSELPKDTENKLLAGAWTALDKSYNTVKNVSDQAAARARSITDPNYDPKLGAPAGPAPASYNSKTPWSGNASADSSFGGVTQIANTPPLSDGAEKKLVLEMMDHLIKLGFTPEQAAGIVANAKEESNFNLGAVGDVTLADKAYGLFQWRGSRYQGLLNYASRTGKSLDDWKTHLDYMAEEMNSYKTAQGLINQHKDDPTLVAKYFDEEYEISSGATTSKRMGHSLTYLDAWKAEQARKQAETTVSV